MVRAIPTEFDVDLKQNWHAIEMLQGPDAMISSPTASAKHENTCLRDESPSGASYSQVSRQGYW